MFDVNKFNTVWLALTYNCNNSCVWCYASSNLQKNRAKTLKRDREKDVINLLYSLGIKQLLLIGGEPTLYPGLTEIVEKTTSKGINVGLVTNGRKLRNKNFVKDLRKSKVGYISVSVEGYNEKTHDVTTNIRGSFSDTMTGLENSLGEDIRTSTNTTISKKNINHLEKIVDFLTNYRLRSITFNICGACIGNPKNSNYTISPSEGVKAFEKVYLYFKSKKKDMKLKLISPVPLCNFNKEILEELKEDKAVKGSCHIMKGRNFVFDYNGDILPCTHFTGFPMFNVFSKGKIMSNREFVEEYNNPENIGYKFRKKLSYYPSKNSKTYRGEK